MLPQTLSWMIFVIFATKLEKKYIKIHDICPKMPKFYTIIAGKIFSRFFFGGGTCPTAPTDTPPFLRLWAVIGLRVNGFPSPTVVLDRPGYMEIKSTFFANLIIITVIS